MNIHPTFVTRCRTLVGSCDPGWNWAEKRACEFVRRKVRTPKVMVVVKSTMIYALKNRCRLDAETVSLGCNRNKDSIPKVSIPPLKRLKNETPSDPRREPRNKEYTSSEE